MGGALGVAFAYAVVAYVRRFEGLSIPLLRNVEIDTNALAVAAGVTVLTVLLAGLAPAWLAARGAAPMAGRLPVLSYGSNRCPGKITWLRRELGLGADPAVVLQARTEGVAAV